VSLCSFSFSCGVTLTPSLLAIIPQPGNPQAPTLAWGAAAADRRRKRPDGRADGTVARSRWSLVSRCSGCDSSASLQPHQVAVAKLFRQQLHRATTSSDVQFRQNPSCNRGRRRQAYTPSPSRRQSCLSNFQRKGTRRSTIAAARKLSSLAPRNFTRALPFPVIIVGGRSRRQFSIIYTAITQAIMQCNCE
jgi:hypothetical protein